MCGIFATMTRKGLAPGRIDRTLSSLDHRGPDGHGSWTSASNLWTLGRTRLSIIGLANGAQTSLPNFILTYLGDRMEMAHSIEGRVPFLDHRVAEVAAAIPVDMKVKGIREKQVLREATKDVLIDEVYNRQKHPYATPPTRDKNDPMLAFYHDTFASRAAKDQPLYDMKKVNAALDKLLDGPVDQRIAVEGGFQRIASVVVMQEKFGMS